MSETTVIQVDQGFGDQTTVVTQTETERVEFYQDGALDQVDITQTTTTTTFDDTNF